MSQPSLNRLFTFKHIIIYLNLLILSGSDCKAAAADVIPEYLPAGEVSSLMTITRQFKSKTMYTFTTLYCQNPISNYGTSINCGKSCYDNNTKTPCHIEELVLSTMGLSGTIDAAVGDLRYLTLINLSNNKLQGPIPASLGNLINLVNLDLSNNQLTGTIPNSLGNLQQKLQYLYLQNNFLEGSIPSELGQLRYLVELFLGFNRLSGSIPDELGDLLNLEYLNLAENRLSGNLPSALGKLQYLKSFWVVSNYFTGKLPESYAQLRNLNWFGVAGNGLSGSLPVYVKDWPLIQNLALQGNNFEGSLPVEYFTLSKLEHLLVSDLNTYPFPLPPSSNFSNIYTLVLRNCSIIGSIPNFIGELSYLKHLDLSFNRLTGGIPESMRPNLVYMSVARNNLNGTIPDWIFQASETRLDLSYNNFAELKSPVPSDLDLNLFACCCCQSSPTTEPYMLQPDQMMKEYVPGKWKPKFYSLYINCGGEQTTFKGKGYDADNETTPFHVSPMRNWAYSFSGDFLVTTANSSDYTKRVPCKISNSDPSLYEEARLSPVALTYHGFSLINGPYNVTLQFAEIVYVDDADYNGLRKRLFDVYIQGDRVLKDFNIKYQAGGPTKATNMTFPTQVNDSLLTIHLFWPGKGSFANAPTYNGPLISAISVDPLFKVGGEKLSGWEIALISVASLAVALLLLLAFAWSMGWLEDKELQELIKVGEIIETKDIAPQQKLEDNDMKVPLKVLVNATGNFSDAKDYKLGSGLLGTVYKAEFTRDRKITVAVKRLSPHHKKKISELIKQEIYNLTSLERNDNVIRMWDFHGGKRLQLLVYEYMEKKSLDCVLFESKMLELTWETRFKICLGIARGLQFLHKHPRFKMVHGNIKPSNILLDGEYEPKLSDFGLTNVYTDEDQLIIIKKEAPKGYLAPEYLQLSSPTRETDIYSYGVVLLEIVCGEKNEVSKATRDSRHLLNDAHRYSKSGDNFSLQNLVDERLDHNTADEDKQALDVLHLAVMCTDISPSRRPTISQILSVLTGKKNIEEIRQSIDDSNKEEKSTADAKDQSTNKNDVSTSKETTSSASTSTALIESADK